MIFKLKRIKNIQKKSFLIYNKYKIYMSISFLIYNNIYNTIGIILERINVNILL